MNNPSTNYLKIGQAAKALGVSIDTLRRWEKAGKITAIRTPGGTRLYHISALKEVNPSSVEHFQTSSLSTEELLKKQTVDDRKWKIDVEDRDWTMDNQSSNFHPQKSTFNPLSSIVSRFLVGSAAFLILTLLLTSWITASYLTNPKETAQFFKNNVAQGLLTPFHKLAEEAVMVISPAKAKLLGFIPPEKPPPSKTFSTTPSSNVLAVTASPQFLEVNADTQINGSLSVRDSINGLTLEATPSSSTIDLTSGNTTLTITKDALLDQDVSTTATPGFNTLNLTGTKNQLVFQSGGPTGTLTWTPTAARTITLPNATTTLVGQDTTDTLTNKSISGSSNTLTSIPNSALSNSKVTVTAGTNMSGGGDVSLGSSITLSLAGSPAISGVLKLADGTAAAPALTFTDDTNTGLYRIGTDKIGLITAGSATSGITIDSSGQVGIGTISPTTTLYVSGTGTITGNTTIGGTLAVNGGTISTSASSLGFTDGTNTLFSIIDKGAYGFIRLSDKGSTGDPATCTAGDVYFNGTDAIFKACTGTDAWANLTAGSSGTTGYWNRSGTSLSPATAGDAVTTSGNISTSGSGTITSVSNLTAGGDLAVNGATSADITSTTDTATVFNSTVTTLSIGGGATTALNIGNGNTAYTAINLGSGTGGNIINIAGTGATGADTINIGTGGTSADTITIGSASATGVSITDNNWGITTAGAGSFVTLAATPGTDTTALTLTGTNVATSNLAYFNAKNTSGTIFNIAYGAAATLAGDLVGQAIDLNNGQITDTAYSVTGLSTTLPTITANNATGTVALKGVVVTFGNGSGVNQTGAGALTYTAADLSIPALTQTAGTLTANGVLVTTPSSITTGGTANAINISATGVGAGTLNGLNIGTITGSSGTEIALAVGTGWDSILKVGSTTVLNGSGVAQVAAGGTNLTSYTAGDLIYASAATTLAQLAGGTANNGKVLVVSSGLPSWGTMAGSSCTDCLVNDPTSTQTLAPTGAATTGLSIKQTSTASPTNDIFNITNSAGTTKYFYVDKNGTVSTGGTNSETLTLTPTTDATALTLVGTNVTTQKLAYFNSKNLSGTIFDLSYGAAATLTGDLIGYNVDLSNNVTATGYSVTGEKITLPVATNTHTSGTKTYKGLVIAPTAGGGFNQNGTGGTTTFTGADITMPALTQTAGTLTGNGVLVTTPSSITTGGTANGLNISASGVGVGTLNGINISNLTAGAGTETALNIGTGWDTGISVGTIAGSATTSYGINIGANTSTGTTNYGLYVGAVSGASGGNYAAVFGTTARVYGSPAGATLMDFYGTDGTTIVGNINNVGTNDSISLAASTTSSRLYLSAGSSGTIRLQRDTRVNQVPFAVYNTDPDCNGSNACERLQLDFSSNVGRIFTMLDATDPGAGVARPLAFGTNNTEAFRIDTSQNLGIGTTAPDARLEINHATGDNLRLTYNDSDGTATNYTDFSLSATGALTLTGSAATLGASATAEKTFLTLTPGTVTLTAPTQVTSLMETSVFTGATLAGDAAITVNKATALSLVAPIDSTNVTLTDSSGLRILNTTSGAGTLTNQYGLYIEDMTAGGSDYGLAIEGADTAALWLSSAADNTDAANGITFGLSKDTNLYRSAANVLKTDDSFIADIDLTVNGNTTLGNLNTADTLTGNLLTSSITSGATTQIALSLATASMTTGEALDITGTWAATDGSDNEGIDLNLTYTPTTLAGTFRGLDLNVTEGANALANTLYGLKVTSDNSANTSTGTHSIYGGYFTATGKTAGTATAVGLYATASGADTNLAAVFGTSARIYSSPADATLIDFFGTDGTTIIGTISNAGTSDSLGINAKVRLFLGSSATSGIPVRIVDPVAVTNGVSFNVMNTDADVLTVAERIQFDWDSNIGRILTTQGASGTARALMFGTNTTEAMRIDTSQNVGIGTSAPDARLEINHATGDNLRLTYNDSDGTATNYTDFSLGTTGALTLTGSAATLGASATAEKTFLTLTPGTVTLTAPTQVTSLMETAVFTGATLAGDAAITVNKATALSLVAPIDSTNVTLTDSSGLRILNTTSGAGTLTNQYGLYIEDMTAGASDYGLAIEGADTAALWLSSAADNTDAANGITFGLSKDTNLYRSAANTLKTDDNFIAAGGIDSTAIGATTASTGAFTTLSATPAGNSTALTLTGTNVTSANLAYFNAKNTSGTISNLAYGAAATLAGSLTGQAIDLSTSVTNAAQSVTGTSITLPVTTAASTTTLKGISLSGGAFTTAAAATTSTWTGLDLTMPNITQGAGSTLTSTGLKITGGTVTSGKSYALITDTNAGYVGIGQSTPAAALHVGSFTYNVTDAAEAGYMVIGNTTQNSGIVMGQGTSNNGFLEWRYNATAGSAYYSIDTYAGTNPIVLGQSGSSVGIGTTGPGGLLDVSKALSGTPSTTGPYLSLSASTFTDSNTAASGTAVSMVFNSIAAPTLAATNATVTTTAAATFYIAGPPTAGTNETITNAYALWAVGNVRIGAGSLCVKSTNAACAGSTAGAIYATTTTVQAADVAENYVSSEDLEPGDVVAPAGDGNNSAIIKSSGSYQKQVLGIISTNPGVTLNSDAVTDSAHPNLYPVALSGRVPVKVSTENGPIAVGDFLTSSATSGVAMKATKPGPVIGKALEEFSSGVSSGSPEVKTGKIMIFISLGFADPGNFLASLTLDNAGNLIMPNIKINKLTIASEIKVDGKLLIKDNPNSALDGVASSAYTDLAQKESTTSAQVADLTNQVASASAQIASAKSDLAKAQSDINDLKLTPPDILMASGSATLANIKVSSEATVSGMLTAYQAEIQDNFKVLGSSTLGNTLIAGDLTVDGTLSLTGSSLSNLSTLYIQNSPLAEGIDIFNGKVKIDKDGNITTQGQIAASEVKTNKLTISNTPIATSSATLAASIGTATLPANAASVTIQTTGITASAKVFITPITTTDKVLSVTNVQPGVSFDVSVLSPATSDIKFNWWIVETL